MIVNKQQIESVDENGKVVKDLVISYVNQQGGISYLKWRIPASEMFEWQTTNRQNADREFQAIDPDTRQPRFDETGKPVMVQWKAYDNKYIKRVPTERDLSESRLNEIINMWGKSVEPIFEANTPQTWFCDIEVDTPPDGFPDADSACMEVNTVALTKFPQTIVYGRKPLSEQQIASIQQKIATYSDITKDYKFEYRYYPTEVEMLNAVFDFITPVPALSGWNFLGYDWKYLYNRANNIGIDIMRVSPTKKFVTFRLNRKIKIEVQLPMHKIIYDYMQLYQMWDRTVEVKEVDTLDWVSERLLGIKKVDHSDKGFDVFYRDFYEDYVFYNAIDTILVEKIDEKIKTAQIWYMLASELHIELNTAYSTIQPAQIVMTNFVYPQYKVLVNVPKKKDDDDKDKDKYNGAFVWPTQPGIYKYIGGLDFASLYPSIMRQFQISPESFMFKDQTYKPKANEIKTCSGAVYRKDPNAVIPAILTHYFAKRKQAKADRKQADTDYNYLMKIYEERKKKAGLSF